MDIRPDVLASWPHLRLSLKGWKWLVLCQQKHTNQAAIVVVKKNIMLHGMLPTLLCFCLFLFQSVPVEHPFLSRDMLPSLVAPGVYGPCLAWYKKREMLARIENKTLSLHSPEIPDEEKKNKTRQAPASPYAFLASNR
jgi:hypothetical protein